MRLGQLARHLESTTTEIVQFLDEQGIEKNDHPNVKLSDEEEKLVISHFRPELLVVEEEPSIEIESVELEEKEEILEALPEDEAKPEEGVVAEQEEEINEVPAVELPTPVETEPSYVSVTAAELNPEDENTPVNTNFDLIKAPKVELPGLKVVGKIDLPEPKLKEESESEEVDEDEEKTEEVTDEPKVITHHRKNARRKLTDEEREARRLKNKREKEKRIARQEARRKQQEERKLKEQKAEHYKQKISKPVPVNKPKKKKSGKAAQPVDTRPKPKTILGKFWRWLNT